MQVLRIQGDRVFLSLACVLIVSQLCLGLNDTEICKLFFKDKGAKAYRIESPKKYFISKLAPLFSDWEKNKDKNIEQEINEIFKKLDIGARLIKNSIEVSNKSFEFLIYVPKYKRSFLVRYTPLVSDIERLVEKEEFRLEFKLFSSWRPLPLDSLFAPLEIG